MTLQQNRCKHKFQRVPLRIGSTEFKPTRHQERKCEKCGLSNQPTWYRGEPVLSMDIKPCRAGVAR